MIHIVDPTHIYDVAVLEREDSMIHIYLVPVTSFEGKWMSTNPGESLSTFENRNFETFFAAVVGEKNCAATNLFEFSNQFQICNQGELRANLGRETDRFQEEILGAF